MRIELSANELAKIAFALTNESLRLLVEYYKLPNLPPEQDKLFQTLFWNHYLEVSALERKVSEAYQNADKKERLARIRPKAA